jgi:hypothetical protein
MYTTHTDKCYVAAEVFGRESDANRPVCPRRVIFTSSPFRLPPLGKDGDWRPSKSTRGGMVDIISSTAVIDDVWHYYHVDGIVADMPTRRSMPSLSRPPKTYQSSYLSLSIQARFVSFRDEMAKNTRMSVFKKELGKITGVRLGLEYSPTPTLRLPLPRIEP